MPLKGRGNKTTVADLGCCGRMTVARKGSSERSKRHMFGYFGLVCWKILARHIQQTSRDAIQMRPGLDLYANLPCLSQSILTG